jgi:hypothetical protein
MPLFIFLIFVFIALTICNFKNKNRTIKSKLITLLVDSIFVLTMLAILFAQIIFNIPTGL